MIVYLSFLFSCASTTELTIQDGSYYIISINETVAEETDLLSERNIPEELFSFSFDISTANKTLTSITDTGEETVSNLKLRSKENWRESCPKGVSLMVLQTFDVDDSPLSLSGLEITSPILYADGCQGDEGAIGEVMLSGDDDSQRLRLWIED